MSGVYYLREEMKAVVKYKQNKTTTELRNEINLHYIKCMYSIMHKDFINPSEQTLHRGEIYLPGTGVASHVRLLCYCCGSVVTILRAPHKFCVYKQTHIGTATEVPITDFCYQST
jgi:hypothetical protein